MNEKISVIVPIYKVEQYLDRCVKSIVEQSYQNLEIILVDDGSPDNCGAICDEWAIKDQRIKVIHKENGGLSDARNVGMEIASGNLISFIDSDDWVYLQFLERLYDTMIQNNADIVECGVYYVREDEEVLSERKCEKDILELTKTGALKRLICENGVYQTVWNKLYKREMIENIQFEVGMCNEDEFWTYQVIDQANKIVVINEPLYYYRQRESSIMGQKYSLKRLDGLRARFLRMEYLQKYDELALFTQEIIRYDCLYHFQAAIRELDSEEQKIVTEYIIANMKKLQKVRSNNSSISLKHKAWFWLFERCPFVVARVRNKIGIGI